MKSRSVLLSILVLTLLLLGLLSSAQATENWVSQSSGTNSTLMGVDFADNDTGWAVGFSGTIRKTSDGGETWGAQTSETSQRLDDVYFANTSVGWAIGWGGTILNTTDGGASWISQTSGTTVDLRVDRVTTNRSYLFRYLSRFW